MIFDWFAAMDTANGACQETFGEPVIYMPASGDPFDITGIFDEAFLELSVVDGAQVATEQPTLGIQTSQFMAKLKPLPVQDDQLQIVRTGDVYIVREPRPDGHGGGRLMLNLVITNG